MSEPTHTPGAPEPLFDDDVLCALLLHPGIDEEEAHRLAARRRRLRRGLTVAAMTGMTLVPAVSLAEDAPSPAPAVTPACEITGAAGDGTPTGALSDDGACVPPAAEPAPPPPVPPAPPAQPAPPAPAADPAPAPDPQPEPGEPTVTQPPPAPEAPAAAPAEAAPAPVEAAPEQSPVGAPAVDAPAAKAVAAAAMPAATRQRRAGATRVRAKRAGAGSASRRHRPAPRRLTRAAPTAAPAAAPPVLPLTMPGALPASFFVTDEPVIPRFLVSLYKEAGRRYGIPWPILAAINEIETDFGRNVAVSSAGATGWMQFMPATWRAYGVDANHDGVKDPDDPHDAIFAAARYLKASGAKHNMRRAIFAYNHAGWYVDSILLRAERIAAHQGERNRRLQRLFVAGARRLERQVLADPRITLYECGRQDIAAHRIDRRVLIALRFLAWSGLHPTVTSLQCGHGVLTSSGNVSEHSTGDAVDIAAINGIPIFGNQGAGSVTEAAIRELLTLRGAMAPHQIISLMSFTGTGNTMAMADHADHIHLGFRPLAALNR